MDQPLLELDNLRVDFHTPTGIVHAVRGLSFSLGRERLGIVGESGCGKSTTAKLVLGLLPATRGTIRFEGGPVGAQRDRAWRALRQRMQMVPQDPLAALDRRLPVGEQVVEPLAIHALEANAEARREKALALFEAAMARGATFEKGAITTISTGERPALIGADGFQRVVDRAVVAAGAWSKPLAAALGDKVPLDTERGYNVSFPRVSGLTSRPIGFEGHGFVMTPLESGLRIGGAVEFGGLEAAPNHARTRILYDKASQFVEGLPAFETGTLWMGFRPSLPDSLPVIGAASRNPHVVYAFGHGHLGLTQSAGTAELAADLVEGKAPAIDAKPFRAQRF
mgnify:CR=1 FL=1